MVLLQESWSRSWKAISAIGDGIELMKDLVAVYEEPQRHYHTLQHLTKCITSLNQ
jgi:predicted metal-dependent HD superfamily phosphohydrolase